MRDRLFEQNVVKNEFERPWSQKVGERQQQRADRGNGEPSLHLCQMFANDFVEPSSQALAHQADTSMRIMTAFLRIICRLRPRGALHPSTVEAGTEVRACELA